MRMASIDRLFLVSNQFVNTMTQEPTAVEQLLPLLKLMKTLKQMKHHWDYIYEPDAKELLEGLLTRYIESQVYQAVVENGACEQAARMLAMKNATDNAGDLIDDLAVDLQQGASVGDHPGAVGNRQRCCGDQLTGIQIGRRTKSAVR